MSTAEMGLRMAKKKGRPKRSTRDDVAVKLDRSIVEMAKHIAIHERITLAELLSSALDGPIRRRFEQLGREMFREGKGKPKGGDRL